ncbi:MAG: RNA-binding protein [bacterium]|nr:RNA-binding protein [bacterium]
MAKKLYVGGINFSTTDEALREAFSQAGTVESATIIMDRDSGRSKGFGFVEMASDEQATAAIEMFNGKELDGRRLTVSEARPMGERPARSGGNSFGGGRNSGGRGNDYGSRNQW